MVDSKILEDFVSELKPETKKTNDVHTAIVSNIDEEGVVWVNINGSDKETPTELSATEVKKGDAVTVQWRNNKLYVASNYTNPAAGVVRVSAVEAAAQTANTAANNAVDDAGRAREAAEDAIATAESVHGIAEQAAEDAADAKQSATNASEYAARALGNLSTVQSVAETLNWITQHGTMTLTSDTALDPTHVYFVRDNNGDYEVGNYRYSVVTEPDVADISTYYELSIDESLNNYVGTHLAVTSEGLWILPEGLSASSYKILIATGGQGHTYEDAGTYIIDAAGDTVAKLGEVITLGIDDGSQSFLKLDYHSIQMTDKEGNVFFHISDLRDKSGEAVITDDFKADGLTRTFNLSCPATTTNYRVLVNNAPAVDVTKETNRFTFDWPPAFGETITVRYSTRSKQCKAYTFGKRNNDVPIGLYSFAEGYDVAAEGNYSHVEGAYTGAVGRCSHAEGEMTGAYGESSHTEGTNSRAHGDDSHAQNTYTIAAKESQTAIGKYNEEDIESDPQKQKALIIGNGTDDDSRSNALTVDWQGNVWAAGTITENNGTRDIDLNISEATITKYVNLGMSLT